MQKPSFPEAVPLLAISKSILLWNRRTDQTPPVLGLCSAATVGQQELGSPAEEQSA